MGYMKYGDETQQIIIWNLPSHSIIPYILDSVICLGVMLTLPLMNYPVIEILEDLLFAQGRILGPPKPETDPSSGQSTVQTDYQPLVDEDDDEIIAILKRLPVANSIPDSVSAWKRNLFRAILVCAESGIAIAFKNEYAYFSAFVLSVELSSLTSYLASFISNYMVGGCGCQ
ncbi:uncharacterized protein [Amphiura filiformis]|uniref:uncharacterized protein isoform X2 n=1 Tax=Amphiura filiformis TaxID=82378 RepID=UPI003B20C845